MRSRFIYSKIPDTAQYQKASWAGQLQEQNCSLVDAKSIAESNPEVSFFFHENRSMLLTGGPDGNRSFSPNDNVFFKGDYWLGSAVGYADTYLIAETYDTADSTTAQTILNQIEMIKIGGGVDTSTGTVTNPVTIKAGFVFCDFQGLEGGNLNTLYQTLVGGNELRNWLRQESKGTVDIDIEVHGSWVNLPRKNTNNNKKCTFNKL